MAVSSTTDGGAKLSRGRGRRGQFSEEQDTWIEKTFNDFDNRIMNDLPGRETTAWKEDRWDEFCDEWPSMASGTDGNGKAWKTVRYSSHITVRSADSATSRR